MSKNHTTKGGWRHFRERLEERYGFTIPYNEWKLLGHQMQNGAGYISRTSLTKSWWILQTSQGQVFALHSSKTKCFISVMPLEMLRSAIDGSPRARKYLGLTEVNGKHRKWYEQHTGQPYEERPWIPTGARKLAPVLPENVPAGSTWNLAGKQGSGRGYRWLLVGWVTVAGWFLGRRHRLF